MDNIVWVATIAGIALGIGILLAIVITKSKEDNTGVVYSYDTQNRLQAILPADNNQTVSLTPILEG